MRIATGHWAAQILSGAMRFEIFTHLDNGPFVPVQQQHAAQHRGGQTYTRGDYMAWLMGAGFQEVEVQSLAPQPVTLVHGR